MVRDWKRCPTRLRPVANAIYHFPEVIIRASLDRYDGGVKVVREKRTVLGHADDTTLIATSKNELLEMFLELMETSAQKGLMFDTKIKSHNHRSEQKGQHRIRG